ncbi:MAG: hypothetical protein JST73_13010 [Actinobacteria bacterium]|nr:hypothetical protein [Actinomycetota bacterium]
MLLQPSRTKRIKPKSKIRPLIFKLFGVIVLLVVIEGGTRACVNGVTSRSIQNNTLGVGHVSVASGAPPAAFYYLILGELRNGSITLDDISAAPVNISSLIVTSQNLRFDRAKLVTGKAKLGGTAPYTTTIYLSPKNLGDYLNATVTFTGTYLTATIDGHNLNVIPKLVGHEIVITDGTYRYTVPLPGKEYLPCKPNGIGIGNGITMSCSAATPPPIIARAAK